jgi:predicted nucleotidyltransferase
MDGIESNSEGFGLTPSSAILDDVVKRVVATAHPVRIVLFGSAVRGQMRSDSDLDLLVIMPDGAHRRNTATDVYRALRGMGISKDIVVVTEKDVREHGDNPSLVLRLALEEGQDLYVA